MILIFVAAKDGRKQKHFFPSSSGAVFGSGMDKNQDPGYNISDPQHTALSSNLDPQRSFGTANMLARISSVKPTSRPSLMFVGSSSLPKSTTFDILDQIRIRGSVPYFWLTDPMFVGSSSLPKIHFWHFGADPDPRIRTLWLTDPTPFLQWF